MADLPTAPVQTGAVFFPDYVEGLEESDGARQMSLPSDDEVTFPVLVLAKDSGDIMLFQSVGDMQYYMERIDVENGEYAAWDATGHPMSLTVQEPIWLKVIPNLESEGPQLRQSQRQFARAAGVELTNDEQNLPPLRLFEAIEAKKSTKRKSLDIFRIFRRRR